MIATIPMMRPEAVVTRASETAPASCICFTPSTLPCAICMKDLIIPICNEGRLPGMGSEADYQQMIEAAGLRVVKFEDLTRKVEETWAICIRRTIKGFFTDPKMWKYVLGKNRSELVFALTLRRIQKAYQCGAMRYGWFVIEKPE